MDEGLYLSLKEKLEMSKKILSDFRENTSIDTIVREYESRISELLKHKDK